MLEVNFVEGEITSSPGRKVNLIICPISINRDLDFIEWEVSQVVSPFYFSALARDIKKNSQPDLINRQIYLVSGEELSIKMEESVLFIAKDSRPQLYQSEFITKALYFAEGRKYKRIAFPSFFEEGYNGVFSQYANLMILELIKKAVAPFKEKIPDTEMIVDMMLTKNNKCCPDSLKTLVSNVTF